MTDTAIYTSEWSQPADFPGGYTQYKIELKKSDHGWFQRHVWRKGDGVSSIMVQDWIPTFDHTAKLDGFWETKVEDVA